MNLDNRLKSLAPRAAELARRLPPHAEGEVLIKLKPSVEVDAYMSHRLMDGVQVMEQFRIPEQMKDAFGGELVRLKLPEGVSTAEGIALLEDDEQIAYVTSNDKCRVSTAPNDERASELWGLEAIDAPGAWKQTTGSRSGPVIAVLDTGIDADHPDLAANLWTNPGEIPGNGIDDDGNGVVDDVHGYNATDGSGNPFDDIGHGTHCAGTIGAVGDNEIGVAGVNWQARLMPVKMMINGEGTVADTVRAVLYATENGADITSNSYGGPYSQPEYEAFAASPLLHICAAGNEGNDNDVSRFYPDQRPVGYPATFELPNVISVAATSSKERLASFSNYGDQTVDLAAPGVKILSTVPGGGYDTKSGTSMATPHVAGVAGLIAAAYPEATPDQIKTRILANVDKLPSLKGKVLTGGRLNAARALEDDRVAPGAPGSAEGRARWDAAELSWTNGADDATVGGPATFTEIRWTEADGRTMKQRVAADAVGAKSRLEIPIMPSSEDRQLTFQLHSIDNAANLSEATPLSVQVPAAEVVELSWDAEGSWGKVELPGRGSVWTDSPEGNYPHKARTSLTSKPFTLKGKSSRLSFETRYRLEALSDQVELQVKEVGKEEWSTLSSYTSYREWRRETVDLSEFDGKNVQLRFQLQTDSAKNDEGFYLDRISVAGEKLS
ncbi:MAG: S8 family serine peptidase [Candidatus Eremiobacteraeota bacterium]|nr:S8 family serine peptidase [Candidatus Eremiobacteraeota bacterium]